MNTNTISPFYNSFPIIAEEREVEVDEYLNDYLNSLKDASNLIDDSIYVVDFHKRCFRFVSDKGIFLCGRSPLQVMQSGYEFYKELVHHDDYEMLVEIYRAVLSYFYHQDTPVHDLAYVVFDFRLHGNRGLLMASHRARPLIVNDQVRMAICTVSLSMNKTPGNLYAYYNDQDFCYQYSLERKRWKKEPMIHLRQREKNILEFSRAGITKNDVAEILAISPNTLRNKEAAIFEKLNVHSMMEAVNYAINHRLIFVPCKPT